MKKLLPCILIALCTFIPVAPVNADTQTTIVEGSDIGYSELNLRGYKWVWSNDKYSSYVLQRRLRWADKNTIEAQCALHDANRHLLVYWNETIHLDSNTFDTQNTTINEYQHNIWQDSPKDDCKGETIKPGTMHSAIAEYAQKNIK